MCVYVNDNVENDDDRMIQITQMTRWQETSQTIERMVYFIWKPSAGSEWYYLDEESLEKTYVFYFGNVFQVLFLKETFSTQGRNAAINV